MPHEVQVEPSGHRFQVHGDDTLLAAALRAGLSFDYGCSNGNCGRCRVKLLAGEVTRVRQHDYVIGEADRLAGVRLACSVAPTGNLVIEAGEATSVKELDEQRVVAQVKEVAGGDGAPWELTLRTPRSQRLRFLSGQRATLVLGAGGRQTLPIASCPCEEGRLRFHVVSAPGRPLAAALHAGALRRFAEVEVSGPYGDFVIAGGAAQEPLLFIAIGAGFAPVRGLVEHALALDEGAPIDLWRVATPATGRYQDNWCRSWADAVDDLDYRWLDGEDDKTIAGHLALLRARGRARRIYLAGPEDRVARYVPLLGGESNMQVETAGIDG